jgi:hypothetical protein
MLSIDYRTQTTVNLFINVHHSGHESRTILNDEKDIGSAYAGAVIWHRIYTDLFLTVIYTSNSVCSFGVTSGSADRRHRSSRLPRFAPRFRRISGVIHNMSVFCYDLHLLLGKMASQVGLFQHYFTTHRKTPPRRIIGLFGRLSPKSSKISLKTIPDSSNLRVEMEASPPPAPHHQRHKPRHPSQLLAHFGVCAGD